jgi:intracellular sulfur oxidation DsrE/DsrF family protein
LLLAGLTGLACAGDGAGNGTANGADNAAESNAVVVQSNGTTPEDLKRALILASNMHEAMSKAKFEVVVYGPSVKLLSAFSDSVPLIQKVQSEGIKVIACGRSLNTEHIDEADMAPGVKVVPYGAVWIVNREKQGWQYIKP